MVSIEIKFDIFWHLIVTYFGIYFRFRNICQNEVFFPGLPFEDVFIFHFYSTASWNLLGKCQGISSQTMTNDYQGFFFPPIIFVKTIDILSFSF